MPAKKDSITVILDGDNTIEIDTETGEILRWDGGVPAVALIASRGNFADEQAKAWAAEAGAVNAVVRRLMERDGIRGIQREDGGSTTLVGPFSSKYASGQTPAFQQWLADEEPDPATLRLLATECVEAFSVSKLEALLGEKECQEFGLIKHTPVSYVRHNRAKKLAHDVRKRAPTEDE